MKRGDVYLVRLLGDAAEEVRLIPAVVVTRDALNQHGPVVVVAPVVDAAAVLRIYPSDVGVHAPEGGLTSDGVVLTAQVRAVPRNRLIRQIGQLSGPVLEQVNRALRITFDLEDYSS